MAIVDHLLVYLGLSCLVLSVDLLGLALWLSVRSRPSPLLVVSNQWGEVPVGRTGR